MEEQKETHWESAKASDNLFFLANSAVYKAGICGKLPWLVRSYFLLPHYRRNVWYLLKTLCILKKECHFRYNFTPLWLLNDSSHSEIAEHNGTDKNQRKEHSKRHKQTVED